MQQIKSFGVIQTAWVLGVLYFVVGLLSAVIMAIAPVAPMKGHPGMLIAVPIAYGLGGFFLSALICLVYNVVAGWIGGIEIELSSGPN